MLDQIHDEINSVYIAKVYSAVETLHRNLLSVLKLQTNLCFFSNNL